MQREYSRLERLIDDLQELSRIEADQFALNIARIDLTNLINTAVIRLQPQFEDKGVGFVLDAPDDLPQTPADADRIYQVLINLLGNALQYTPAGGRVKLKAHVSNGEAIVSVTDTGIGIAAEHIPLIFERFYRVDKSRARIRGGSGIGLTIAKHLVEAHGGRISAASEGPGRGSTFTFTIPVR
jgi:histidine kinase